MKEPPRAPKRRRNRPERQEIHSQYRPPRRFLVRRLRGAEFEGWLETLEICQDKRVVREIKKAERAADRRKTRPFEEVFGRPLR